MSDLIDLINQVDGLSRDLTNYVNENYNQRGDSLILDGIFEHKVKLLNKTKCKLFCLASGGRKLSHKERERLKNRSSSNNNLQ